MITSTLLAASLLAPQADPGATIAPELLQVFERDAQDPQRRVFAVLGEQLSLADLLDMKVGRHPRGVRQGVVAGILREFADERQVELLALLSELEQGGHVSEVRQLWAGNAVIFEGDAAAVHAVAALPEVDRIGWDPPRDAGELQDAALCRPAPASASVPEPNLVEVQAPDLWALGFQGQGVQMLNIDSGVDYDHPDLRLRIWHNPNETLDGVDNDANGYVDDIIGWDFFDGDSDPYPGAGLFGGLDTHGTNTAGIMVGDGSTGSIITGMAPKAKMAVARISGESDHWLAMQYSLSVAMDCSSSSYSFKWSFSPKPDYHMHRQLQDMLLAAGIIHANSIGNQGGDPSHPVPFQVSAPGLAPAPWRHPVQTQAEGGVSGVMGCGAVEIGGAPYSFSSHGPSAWENIALYDSGYPHAQDPVYWDYPYGGFGGGQQGLVKPDVVMPTNVQTTTVGGGYLTFGGTSAATPHLGGAMALLVSVNPAAEPRHICQALQVSAADLGVAGKDSLFGAGRVQILDAAKRIMHLVKVDDVAPHLGDTVTASVHGNAGASYATLFGFTAGTLSLPGFTLDIVPPFFVLLGGALDGAGTASTSFPVPVDVGLVGVTVYLQSGENDLAGLTGEVLISTLESFRIRS